MRHCLDWQTDPLLEHPVRVFALLVFAGLLAMVSLTGPAQAQSLRCDGRLVSVGDRRFDLIAACGEPDLRVPVRLELLGAVPVLPYEEVWYYNFGPHRLIREVRLRSDRVMAIESAGYGFTPAAPGSCRPEDLRRGMTVFELLARCGEPADQAQRLRQRGPRTRYPLATASVVLEEEWIYDFGPARFYRIVTVVDGRVADVDTGRRGRNP